MCCDWFDVLVGVAGGFVLGCLVTGTLAKMIILEQTKQESNLFKRTELKNANIEWK